MPLGWLLSDHTKTEIEKQFAVWWPRQHVLNALQP
jgi:hypothetical protein